LPVLLIFLKKETCQFFVLQTPHVLSLRFESSIGSLFDMDLQCRKDK
jgi:hypothetical protein